MLIMRSNISFSPSHLQAHFIRFSVRLPRSEILITAFISLQHFFFFFVSGLLKSNQAVAAVPWSCSCVCVLCYAESASWVLFFGHPRVTSNNFSRMFPCVKKRGGRASVKVCVMVPLSLRTCRMCGWQRNSSAAISSE